MTELQSALDDLYRLTIRERKTTSTKRLSILAEYCAKQLELRGLKGAEAEVTIDGGGRPKDWDVAWKWAGKYRLVMSLKSILKNPGGTVPNRLDDLMGETANIQLYSPEVVTGYVVVFDITACGDVPRTTGEKWLGVLNERLAKLSGRRAPYWAPGTFEAHSVVVVDFASSPKVISGADALAVMFDQLVREAKVRNPGIDSVGER